MPRVNPEILIWAREQAELSPSIAAKKLGFKQLKDSSAEEKLLLIENGDIEPTRPILVKMVKIYCQPLLTFYLSSPPLKGNRGQDFRSLPLDYSRENNHFLDVLLRNILARQSMLKVVLEEDEDFKPLSFIGSITSSEDPSKVIEFLKNLLKIDISEFQSQQNSDEAFSYLRSKVESVGIFVLLIGDLGSYHTAIDVDIFRGFALADNIAPFIVINDQDSHSAWSFTLIHELVHLLLGNTGISSANFDIFIEKYCNQIAGELLLPSELLNQFPKRISSSIEDLQNQISSFAQDHNISSSMVAYKLYLTGDINQSTWSMLNKIYRELWYDERDSRRKKARESDGGPNYYIVRQHRVGKPLIHLIQNLITDGSLTTYKAGKILGVKPKNVQPLISTIK